jgi:membrane protease YdiL (CAAX protease family)
MLKTIESVESTESFERKTLSKKGSLWGVAPILLILSIYPIAKIQAVRDLVPDFGIEHGSALVVGAICVLLASFFLRARGVRWREVGLEAPARIGRTILLGLAVMVGVFAFANIGGGILIEILDLPQKDADISSFSGIKGNLPLLLYWLAVSWTTAAFFEEMIFRGFMLNQLADVFGGTKAAFAYAALAQGVLFGVAHFYQGVAGMILTGFAGVAFGFSYLIAKRSLWPVVVGHGMLDSVLFSAIYFGWL